MKPSVFLNWVWAALRGLPAAVVILLIRSYQWFLSPWLGPRCRYQPTCSSYFIQAVQKYGVVSGSMRGLRRIARCHPWGASGYDPP